MLIRAGYDIGFMAQTPTCMITMLNLHPSRILMAAGRDAADTALSTAFGSVWLTHFKVYTDEIAEEALRLAA
jgi:hypothetical protein